MKLKTLWKKANRGVLLAIVLILVLCCYIVIDKLTFSNEKPEIDETMQTYLTTYLDALTVSEDFITAGGTWDASSIAKQRETLSEIIKTYWTDTFYQSNNGWYSQIDKGEFLETLQSTYSDSLLNQGYITNIDNMISNVRITKNGPGAAIYTCTLKFTTTTQGTTDFVSVDGNTNTTNANYWYDDSTSTVPVTETQTLTFEYDVQVELLRENGTWKISNLTQQGWSTYSDNTAFLREVA